MLGPASCGCPCPCGDVTKLLHRVCVRFLLEWPLRLRLEKDGPITSLEDKEVHLCETARHYDEEAFPEVWNHETRKAMVLRDQRESATYKVSHI